MQVRFSSIKPTVFPSKGFKVFKNNLNCSLFLFLTKLLSSLSYPIQGTAFAFEVASPLRFVFLLWRRHVARFHSHLLLHSHTLPLSLSHSHTASRIASVIQRSVESFIYALARPYCVYLLKNYKVQSLWCHVNTLTNGHTVDSHACTRMHAHVEVFVLI